jgi:hypothetical protein
VAGSFILTTANDFEGRDPVAWEIFGTNAEIVTENNGTGQNEPWVAIGSGTVDTPLERFTEAPEVFFDNTTAYASYKFIVREIRDPLGLNNDSTQYSEFQLFTAGATSLAIEIKKIRPNLENNEVTITWDAPPGRGYQLEASPDLINWDGPVTGGDITVEQDSTLSFQPPGGAKVFYRIVLAPL